MHFFTLVTEKFSEYLQDYPQEVEETEFVKRTTNLNAQRSLITLLRSMTFSGPDVSLMVPSGEGLGVKLFEGSGGIPLDINGRAASGPGTLMILMGPTLGGEEVEFFITLTGQEQYGNVQVFNNINFDPGRQWVPEQVKALSLGDDLYLWWHGLYGNCLATAFVAFGTCGLAADLEGFALSLNATWQRLVDQIERTWDPDCTIAARMMTEADVALTPVGECEPCGRPFGSEEGRFCTGCGTPRLMESGPYPPGESTPMDGKGPSREDDVRALMGPGANLNGAHLVDMDLSNLDLSGASLVGANLEGARICGSILDRATLTDACLRGADLSGAGFEEVDADGVNLEAALLTDVCAIGASLVSANLAGARVHGADFQGANLTGGDLRDLDGGAVALTDPAEAVPGQRLLGWGTAVVDLAGADLTNADLSRAVLTEANLKGAVLTNTNFTDADLTGADLTEANLDSAILCRTTMPDGRVRSSVPGPENA